MGFYANYHPGGAAAAGIRRSIGLFQFAKNDLLFALAYSLNRR